MLTREGLKPGGCTSIYLLNETASFHESVNWTYQHFYSLILSSTRLSYIQREADVALIILEFASRGSLFLFILFHKAW